MLLNRILNISDDESIILAEESLVDLIDLPATCELLSEGIEADRAIEIREEMGFALHLNHPGDLWLLLTDRHSNKKVLKDYRKQHQELLWSEVEAKDDDFFEAILECLSTCMAKELFCDACAVKGGVFLQEERIKRLGTMLDPIIQPKSHMLEICCGSGIATQSLYRLGHHPFSMDLDRCELCQGIREGLLDPRKSFVLDARRLSRLFQTGSFDIVVGFMVGLIDQSNWNDWQHIILTASGLSRNSLLYTVYSKKEAELIANALQKAGWEDKIIDNRDPFGIYDQWIVRAERKRGWKD